MYADPRCRSVRSQNQREDELSLNFGGWCELLSFTGGSFNRKVHPLDRVYASGEPESRLDGQGYILSRLGSKQPFGNGHEWPASTRRSSISFPTDFPGKPSTPFQSSARPSGIQNDRRRPYKIAAVLRRQPYSDLDSSGRQPLRVRVCSFRHVGGILLGV